VESTMLGKSVRPVAPATSPVFEITICDLKRDCRLSIAKEALSDLACRSSLRAGELASITASSPLDAAVRDQLK